jgi:hypothetical protein
MSIQIGSSLSGRIKRVEIHAVITRANGTVEDKGCVAAADFTTMGRAKSAFRRIFGGKL